MECRVVGEIQVVDERGNAHTLSLIEEADGVSEEGGFSFAVGMRYWTLGTRRVIDVDANTFVLRDTGQRLFRKN